VRLEDVLTDAARRSPDRTALVTDEETLTFAQLAARVERRAASIAAVTVPGDRVAILSENRAEYVEHYYAVPAIDRVLVPLNHRLHEEEWRRAIARAGARVLVAEPDLLARLGDVAVDHVLTLADSPPPITATAASPADRPGPSPDPRPDPPPVAHLRADSATDSVPKSANSVAWLVGTSGTTRRPKLAMLTHAGLLAAVDATLAARPVGTADVLLTPFPLCHVAGYNVLVMHRRARPVVLMRRFDPLRLAALATEHRVTMLSLAPTMLAMLLDHSTVDDADGARSSAGTGTSRRATA